MEDDGFTMNGNGRLYFANTDQEGWDPKMYWQTPLLDKQFSYTVDLSNVGCHCNANTYFVGMPGLNAGDGGDYYCDAFGTSGNPCPQYDTMESNKYNAATTMRSCDGSGDGQWDKCDWDGCQGNAYDKDSKMMCPSEE